MNKDTATPCVRVKPPAPHYSRWTKYNITYAPEAIYFHDLIWDRSKSAIDLFLTDTDGNIIHPELVEVVKKPAGVPPDKYGAAIVVA